MGDGPEEWNLHTALPGCAPCQQPNCQGLFVGWPQKVDGEKPVWPHRSLSIILVDGGVERLLSPSPLLCPPSFMVTHI